MYVCTISTVPGVIPCPGIKIVITCPCVSKDGHIAVSASAAAVAFSFPFTASSYVNKHCRVGLEYDTFPESTKVMVSMPHPNKVLATAHPNVPAPIKHHTSLPNAQTRELKSNNYT